MRGGAGGTPGRGSTLIRSFLLSAVFLCVPAALREILFFMWRKKVPRAKTPKRKEDMKSDPSDRAEDGPQCGPYKTMPTLDVSPVLIVLIVIFVAVTTPLI